MREFITDTLIKFQKGRITLQQAADRLFTEKIHSRARKAKSNRRLKSLRGALQRERNAAKVRELKRTLRHEFYYADQRPALCKAGQAKPLSARLKAVDSPEGRKRLAEHLKSLPYPHYEPAPGSAGLLVRIEANGKRTRGRFVSRRFRPAKSGNR